jgi:fumarate hydratase subunit alpha
MNQRTIKAEKIKDKVKELCLKANTHLRPDVLNALKELYDSETKDRSKGMLGVLVENALVASKKKIPICQDTGVTCVFVKVGQGLAVEGDLRDAINTGVQEAYLEGSFRKSVVQDPIKRNNTGTNTPAVIHFDIVPGDKIEITVMPKGFGSENKSRLKMMNPTATSSEIVEFCVGVVEEAGPDACPPYVIGIGLGGTADESTLIAKKALLRDINVRSKDEHIRKMEKEILEKVNSLEIGVMGLGGIGTALAVNIETSPTHIAGLPVAVNIGCHAMRSATGII